MKKKPQLHTNFIKFIFEKHKNETQKFLNEKTNISNKGLADEFDEIINNEKSTKKIVNEVNDENQEDINTLLEEYLTLEKKYNLKRNDSLFNRK